MKMPYSEKFAKLVDRIREHPDHLVAVIVHLNEEEKGTGYFDFGKENGAILHF